jgi:hypothetical protein
MLNSKHKPQSQNNEEAQEYMDLIEKEFISLGIKEKHYDDHFIDYRFSEDKRYEEAWFLLDSSRHPFRLRVEKIQGYEQMNDQERDTAKAMIHENWVLRQFAKCVGRGACNLGTVHTVPTEKLKIPSFWKVGLLYPDDKRVEYKEENLDLQNWAEFHNGVATGLQLATEFDPFSNHIKNWILYHKPPQDK